MDRPAIYIETTIVSYLAGRPSRDLLVAACQQATHEWWRDHRERYELYTSQLVIAEAERGDSEAAGKRLEYLTGVPEVPVTPEVGDLAKALVAHGALPARATADALHIAVAAVHGIDLLLTWNCRHIDNPGTKPAARSVCAVAGFACPEICTPIEILEAHTDAEE